MIFGIHYFLVMGGYSAAGVLLGAYLTKYAGASEWDLGFVFMIQPILALARPMVSARADRFQSHKKMLVWFLLGNSISYLPFVILPFILKYMDGVHEILPPRICFWIFTVAHTLGSICFCGVRSLGDALVVNYAKRIGSDFTIYRKFGAIGYGSMGYLLGLINEGWYLPDYVPICITYVAFLGLHCLLVHLWHDEYFVMVSEADINQGQLEPLPDINQVFKHMEAKAIRELKCCCTLGCYRSHEKSCHLAGAPKESEKDGHKLGTKLGLEVTTSNDNLSLYQQFRILLLLMRRDLRIPMFMFMLFFGGIIGYGPQNFVFTYLDRICNTRGTCDSAALAGLVIICFCISESICYLILARIRSRNFVCLLQLSFLSYCVHYLFYGLVLEKVSPYYFLIESLHGIEYSTSISTSMELGYKFANEVSLIIPDLIERKIIDKETNQDLVRLSLMATMSSCFSLVFEGAGPILGSFATGYLIDKYSFSVAWNFCGAFAGIAFVVVIFVVSIGKCIGWRPQILQLESC